MYCETLPVMKISILWNAKIVSLWNLLAYENFQDYSIIMCVYVYVFVCSMCVHPHACLCCVVSKWKEPATAGVPDERQVRVCVCVCVCVCVRVCVCVCVTKKKSARRMASTTSDTGDTSSKQRAQRKENYNKRKRPVSSVDHCHPYRRKKRREAVY